MRDQTRRVIVKTEQYYLIEVTNYDGDGMTMADAVDSYFESAEWYESLGASVGGDGPIPVAITNDYASDVERFFDRTTLTFNGYTSGHGRYDTVGEAIVSSEEPSESWEF